MTWIHIAYLKGDRGETGPENPAQASRFTAIETLITAPGGRVENRVIDPIPFQAGPDTYGSARLTVTQAPQWGRAICTEVGAVSVYPYAKLGGTGQDSYFPAAPGTKVSSRVILRGHPTQRMSATLNILGHKWNGTAFTPATTQPGFTSTQLHIDPNQQVTFEAFGVMPAGDATHFTPNITWRRYGETYPQVSDYIYFRQWAVQSGPSAVLASPVPYVDGSNYSGAYWTGETNASSTIQLIPNTNNAGGGDVGLTHAVLLDDFTYRRGGAKKIGKKTSISFRIDHGLANFNTKMRTKLETHGFKYALALGSRDWGASENAGVSAAMVNAWVLAGLAEIWSHGPSHDDADTEAKLRDYIVNSRAELEAALPAATVDGFMPPGAGGTGYSGFRPITTPAKYFGTLAGQLILQTYAVGTGELPNTAYRVQDGRPRVGQAYFNMDTFDAAGVMVRINNAITAGQGIQLMIHPSLIDTGGITTADLNSILDQIKALQTAGTVTVMSAYDQLLADSTTA